MPIVKQRVMKQRAPLWSAAILAIGTIGVLLWQSPLFGAEAPVVIAPPKIDNPKTGGPLQSAVLAGGCFWGVQGVYEHVRGVRKVIAGYAGGERATAQYETVSSGTTGHAESVKIVFDPAEISYGQILQIAFSVVHDPTQLNRQGPDVGSGYRSDIFYMSDQQRRIAQTYIAQLAHASVYPKPIVTRVDAFSRFNPVGIDQQDFMIKNPRLEYIEVNDLPKLTSLKQLFPASFAPLPREYH